MNIQQLNKKQIDELQDFWIDRYHQQAERPVTMSPTGQVEGGYGLWNASLHMKELVRQGEKDPSLKKDLIKYAKTPYSPEHPVTKQYLERLNFMEEQYKKSPSVDKDRLGLQIRAEKKGYEVFISNQRHLLGKRPGLDDKKQQLKNEFSVAMKDVYSYDRKHNHPITDPDRNLRKDPPTLDERRAWMVDRQANFKDGISFNDRVIDTNNNNELAGLGLIQKRFMTQTQLNNAEREAPARQDTIVPEYLRNQFSREQQLAARAPASVSLKDNIIQFRQQENKQVVQQAQQKTSTVSTKEVAPAFVEQLKAPSNDNLNNFRAKLRDRNNQRGHQTETPAQEVKAQEVNQVNKAKETQPMQQDNVIRIIRHKDTTLPFANKESQQLYKQVAAIAIESKKKEAYEIQKLNNKIAPKNFMQQAQNKMQEFKESVGVEFKKQAMPLSQSLSQKIEQTKTSIFQRTQQMSTGAQQWIQEAKQEIKTDFNKSVENTVEKMRRSVPKNPLSKDPSYMKHADKFLAKIGLARINKQPEKTQTQEKQQSKDIQPERQAQEKQRTQLRAVPKNPMHAPKIIKPVPIKAPSRDRSMSM